MNKKGIGEELFRGISEFVTVSNKRYFWIVTHLRIFRRESERPAKCKTMKMGDGAEERERKVEHVSRPFYSILFVVLTSLSRYYYFRLLGDESPFVAIIASFMTDNAVHNNTLDTSRAAS